MFTIKHVNDLTESHLRRVADLSPRGRYEQLTDIADRLDSLGSGRVPNFDRTAYLTIEDLQEVARRLRLYASR